MSAKGEVVQRENAEVVDGTPFLDMPELVLESILARLSPAGLCNMAGVCSSMRERCRSDYLWERHMEEKWGRVIGKTAVSELQLYLASRRDSLHHDGSSNSWIRSLSAIWPLSWMRFKLDETCKSSRDYVPADSVMSRYMALESGKFWFSAQVYNRENGHIGFLLSCYDAELNYDWHTNTFRARYPPHGRRTIVTEDGVSWERIRGPPINTPAHELHVSDCLKDLHPGDHIEIQWRRNKEFPYGWWYGMVGHLEFCDGSELHCCCHKSDIVVLEFKQYGASSRWRRSTISRNDHREEGNETDGFYGGIRKLRNSEEISRWKQLFPAETLE